MSARFKKSFGDEPAGAKKVRVLPLEEVMEPYWVVELAELEVLGLRSRLEGKQPIVIVSLEVLTRCL